MESATLDAVILGGELARIQNEALRSRLTAWHRDVEVATRMEGQEYDFFAEVWIPFLRANSNLAQISNTTKTIPGTTEPFYGIRIPASQEKVDNRPLLRDRELQNALVQKIWIQDDVLHQYNLLKPRLKGLIELLEAEVSR